eukprot:2210940-Pleurochrysis_carterae.AAC.1
MILRVDVLVAENRFVEKIGSGGSLPSTQQQAAVAPALVLCYHLPTAGMPPRPGMPRAWLRRR